MQVVFFERGRALEVRLNRPKALNAINTAMVGAMLERLAPLARCSDGAMRLVVLTGAGGKVHCPCFTSGASCSSLVVCSASCLHLDGHLHTCAWKPRKRV